MSNIRPSYYAGATEYFEGWKMPMDTKGDTEGGWDPDI